MELILLVDSALAKTGLEGLQMETYLRVDRQLSRKLSQATS